MYTEKKKKKDFIVASRLQSRKENDYVMYGETLQFMIIKMKMLQAFFYAVYHINENMTT